MITCRKKVKVMVGEEANQIFFGLFPQVEHVLQSLVCAVELEERKCADDQIVGVLPSSNKICIHFVMVFFKHTGTCIEPV